MIAKHIPLSSVHIRCTRVCYEHVTTSSRRGDSEIESESRLVRRPCHNAQIDVEELTSTALPAGEIFTLHHIISHIGAYIFALQCMQS